jgi:hypothetical protein
MTNSAEEVFYQKTYAFNETIRTSDSSDFVGAEADIYRNSKNFYYGSYDDVSAYLDEKTKQ